MASTDPGPDPRIHRAANALRVRWRNGGGWTREIVRSPVAGDDFDWRLSVAEVEVDGPFSEFAGHDREMVLLGGAGMELRFSTSGQRVVLRSPLARVRFSGDDAVEAKLIDGPTSDLNLIWRRDRCEVHTQHATLGVPSVLGGGAEESVVAYVVDGELAVDESHVAGPGDAVITAGGQALNVDGRGTVLAFVISRQLGP